MPCTPPPGGVEAEQRYTPVERRPVGVPPRHRPEHRLAQGRRAAVDVAAQQVRVVRLGLGRRPHRPGQHPVAEAGGEALDLRLHPLAHVDVRAVRHVAVAPERVLPRRAPGSGRRHRAGRRGRRGCSGWRPARTAASERATSSKVPPTWTVTVRRHASALQGTGPSSAQSTLQAPGPGRKRAHGRAARRDRRGAGQRHELARRRRRAARHGPGGARRASVTQRPVCTTPPRRRTSAARPSRDGGAAALDDGPADAVAQRGEQEPERRRQRRRERLHGVRGRAGQQRPGRVGA